MSPWRRVQKRRMEGGWPAAGRFLLYLTVNLLLPGKMGQEQGKMGMLFWIKSRNPLILQN